MKHGHKAWTCSVDVRHEHEVWTCSQYVRHIDEHAAWTYLRHEHVYSIEMQSGYEAWTWSTDLLQGHGA
jgi:hypothetical protein